MGERAEGGWCPGCDSRDRTERRAGDGVGRGEEQWSPGTHPRSRPSGPTQPWTIRIQGTPGQGCGASARDGVGAWGRQAAAPPWALHPVTRWFPGRRDVGCCPTPPALEPARASGGPEGTSAALRGRGVRSAPKSRGPFLRGPPLLARALSGGSDRRAAAPVQQARGPRSADRWATGRPRALGSSGVRRGGGRRKAGQNRERVRQDVSGGSQPVSGPRWVTSGSRRPARLPHGPDACLAPWIFCREGLRKRHRAPPSPERSCSVRGSTALSLTSLCPSRRSL